MVEKNPKGERWLALGERLTPLQLMGGGLCLIGVWVCQRLPSGRKE